MGHNTFNHFLLEFLQSMENSCIVTLILMESSDLKSTTTNAERVLTRIVKGGGFGGTSLPSIQELKEASQSNQPVQTPTSSK